MKHTQLNAIGIVGGVGPRVDPLLLTKILDIQSLHSRIRDQDSLPLLLAQCAALRVKAPTARNMIARGKREARRPWVTEIKRPYSPERA